MKKKIKNILGLTILEALMATAVVGIGFVAILSMVNYSVQSIDTSGERTKANYLVSMMAEDVIGHKNSIYGVNTNDKVVIGIDGTITIEGVEKPDARKFSDHLAGQDFLSRCGDNLAQVGGDTAANAPEWGTISSDWVKLARTDVTAVSEIAFQDVFTADYDIYKVYINNVTHITGNYNLHFRFLTSGSTEDSSSNYNFRIPDRVRFSST